MIAGGRRDDELGILFQDEHFVAFNKPAGLATIPGRAEATSVLQELAAQLRLPSSGTADPRVRVVHRLDKDTSGVLLFAKDIDAQRHVSLQFQSNTIEKEYLALVAGRTSEDSGEIDAPIAPHPTVKTRMTTSKHGRAARTLWKVEARYREFTLLRCFPKTGKTHQIRVHLASIGLPLAIDPIYNARAGPIFLSQFKRGYRQKPGEQERPLIERLTLHAEKLAFTGFDGSKIEILAPLPKDFRVTINQLSRSRA